MARGPDPLQQVLTLGGRAPRVVGGLLVAMAAATLAGLVVPGLAQLLDLRVPPADAGGWLELLEAWRLVTWPLVQGGFPGGLLDLIFGGLMLVWLGGQLSFAWSERRFASRVAVITAGAGLLTVLLFAALGLPFAYRGLWPLTVALLVTWGLVFPGQRVSWFGVLDMSGATVAKVVAVGTPIWALAVGPGGLASRLLAYAPHLFAILVAWLALADGPRRRWYRLKSWWARRRLESARKRFKVITTDRPPPPPKQWMN